MTTLTEFLMARIAEDEAAARGAQPQVWYSYFRQVVGRHLVLDALGGCVEEDDVFHAATKADARHIARWDPARVLAECAAKRRIVAEHSADRSDPDHCAAHDGRYRIQDCPTLQALALPYADHPDWREEWRL